MNLLSLITDIFGQLAERYTELIIIIAIALVVALVLVILMIVAFGSDRRKFKDYDEDGFDDVYHGPIEYKAPTKEEHE